VRTIDWVGGAVEVIDQTALPDELRVLRLSTVDDLVDAVRRLAVRGAPALGVAGALGVALAARLHDTDPDALARSVRAVRTARPTAVNLDRGAGRAAARLGEGPDAVLAEALLVRDEEIASSAEQGRRGADLLTELCGPALRSSSEQRPAGVRQLRLLTHCNTGALAAVVGGTALAAAVELHRRGALAGVVASETRPLLQGARLTAWELAQSGVPCRVAVDGAGPFLMARGEVDAVVVGADRICANGDVVNKVGTFAHALGAAHAGIPFVVVAPESTVDESTPDGAAVPIEDRGAPEVLTFRGRRTAPEGADAVNPAFDVTPAALVTAIVTDRRVLPGGRWPAADAPR
jgi:methylthioribose-1-phosphate isomerase